MPTRLRKRFDRTGRASGPRNHARPGRRSSDRWKTGLPNSNSASETSRLRDGRARPAGGARAAWRGSFRRSSRSAPVRRRCQPRAANNAEDGGAGEVVADEARACPRRRSRERQRSRGRHASLGRSINRHGRAAAEAGRVRPRRLMARRETAGRQTVPARAHREMVIRTRRTAGDAGAVAVVAGRAVAEHRIQAAQRPINHPPVDGKHPPKRE